MQASPSQFTTIVMPALNEEHYIAEAIRSLLPADDTVDFELLVLDGGSTDCTRRIVEGIVASNSRVKFIHNPRRTQSAAMNIGAEICDPRTAILLRADCHAVYPPGFVENCVDALGSAASSSVVVSMRAVGKTPVQKAIAAAQNSKLGNGGSRHRGASQSGYVDHGHHAAFDRATFRSLGGYDESAPFNEDAEFDARLAQSGGRIYLDSRSIIDYFPRSSFSSLAKQYYRHGWGRANTLVKHGMRPKLRQVLPVVILLTFVLATVAWPFVGAIALLPPAGYLALCLTWGVFLAFRFRQPELALAGLAAVIMHLSWAAGFLRRAFETKSERSLRLRSGEA
ncbi:MAG: glycosyltransferase family 2 protein [Hyphomicrobium sp.]|uniref:glycosyltransferase family 2 protein n=1 Tax=Hyphomicrobium sp. TaxID=82 RepID=UPI0039E2F016